MYFLAKTMKNRRQFLRCLALGTTAALAPWNGLLLGGNILQDVNMKILRRRVGYFTGRGGTIGYLINENGIGVVDTQFPDTASILISKLREQSQQPIDLLINTHHHGDHTAGNIAFKGLIGKIAAHENSRKNQERAARERGAESEQLYPEEVYKDKWSHEIGDETISMRYFGPAHTDGDSVVHFEKANVIHMGDLIFNRRHPFIDKTAGASISNWITVLQEVRKVYDRDAIFIFGHSGGSHPVSGDIGDIQAMENYLSRLTETVSKKLKAGADREEIMAIQRIDGAPEWQGDGIGRPLAAAYQELAEE